MTEKPVKFKYGYTYKGYAIFHTKWGWEYRWTNNQGYASKTTSETLKKAVESIDEREGK